MICYPSDLLSLFFAPCRESRSSGSIARVLNNKVRVLSVGVKNNCSIRCSDGEAEDNWSTLLAEDKTEGKVLSGCKAIGGAGTVGRRTTAHSLSIVVVQAIASNSIISKVQEGDVVNLGCSKSVITIDLSEDVSAVVENEITGGHVFRGAVEVHVRSSRFVDTTNLSCGAIVVGSVGPVV